MKCWRAAYSGLINEKYLDEMDPETFAGAWRRRMDDPSIRGWIAEDKSVRDDADIAGFAVTGASRDADAKKETGELYAIYVRPELIGKSVGKSLLANALRAMEEQQFTRCAVWVLLGNEVGRKFYQRQGFIEDGTSQIHKFGEQELEMLRYQLNLAGHRGFIEV